MTRNEMNKVKTFFESAGLSIEFSMDWKNNGVEKMIFTKPTGETISFYASSESGCETCDWDGSNCNNIEIY